ncbi:MAG: tetratricopeptide repeat protein [Xanthomonadales bacterium]|nr:tetratricopeptide repeat protein [Xanthomonadales bacterium]
MVQGSHQIQKFGDLSVDLTGRRATVGVSNVELEPRLFDLLAFMVGSDNAVVTKDDLLREVWDGRIVTDAAIAQAVAKLRRALKQAGMPEDPIKTVHGKGYRWDLVPETQPAPAPPGRRATRPWHWLAGAVVLVLGLIISFRPEELGDTTTTLAVAPFAIAAEADLDWAELGLAALLAESVQARTPVKVIPASRVRSSLNTLGIAADAAPAEKLEALQRLVGADHLLLADIGRSDTGYRVSYQLASAGGVIGQGEFSQDRLDQLSYELTEKLARDIDVAYQAGIPVRKISADDFVNEAFARGLQALLSGDAASARAYFESALASDPNLHWARYELGNALNQLGEWEPAGAAFNQVMDSAEAGGDLNLAGAASSGLGILAWRNGDLGLAENYFSQARDWFQSVGNDANLASAYGNLGILADNQQRWSEARELYNRALALYRNEGEKFGESAVYSNLAVIERKQGRLESAASLQQRAVDIQTAAGLRQMLVFSLSHAGKIAAALGQWSSGEQSLRDALALAEELSDPLGAAEARSAIAEMLLEQGRLQEAMGLMELALPAYQELNNPGGAARAQLILSFALKLAGDDAGAAQAARLALDQFRDLGDRQLSIQALLAWADADTGQADSLVGEALSLAQELGDSQTLALVELGLAALARDTDPRPHFEGALEFARAAGDRRTEAAVAFEYSDWLIDLAFRAGADLDPLLESLLGVAEAWQPEHHRALYLRGCYLALSGQTQDALQFLERSKAAAAEIWSEEQESRLGAVRAGTGLSG